MVGAGRLAIVTGAADAADADTWIQTSADVRNLVPSCQEGSVTKVRLLVAGAIAVAGTLVPAGAAHADCPDGWCGAWGTIVASPYLTVRSTPRLDPTNANVRGHANANDTVEIHCWVYGDYVGQGNWPSSK